MTRAPALPLAITLAMAALALGSAGARLAAQTPAFHAGVDMVALNVTVTNPSGGYITDLTRTDFSVSEDGRPQHIVLMQKSDVPLAVALLLDSSGSMADCLPEAQKAAVGFVETLGADDLASIIPFDASEQRTQTFTRDTALLERAIRGTVPSGFTALYDTVYVTLRQIERTGRGGAGAPVPRRQAILLLTDGFDSSSLVTLDDLLDAAAHSNVAIYAIGLASDIAQQVRPENPQYVLRQLADRTGGRAYFPTSATKLAEIYRQIKTELSDQYLLGYRSDHQHRDGTFRQVTVRVQRDGATARTRPGYFAAAE